MGRNLHGAERFERERRERQEIEAAILEIGLEQAIEGEERRKHGCNPKYPGGNASQKREIDTCNLNLLTQGSIINNVGSFAFGTTAGPYSAGSCAKCRAATYSSSRYAGDVKRSTRPPCAPL